MNFPTQFIGASAQYAGFERQVPAPYLRRRFRLEQEAAAAQLLIAGLGFYRVFLNGTELTKSPLAPYISNPDDVVYYDRYDARELLRQGENVIGVLLGNGMQNAYGGFVWDFDKARWRGAPRTALRLSITLADGTEATVESDETFRTHPSPLLENELRCGEVYDARREPDGWDKPGYDETGWQAAVRLEPPRGEYRLCTASPVVVYERRAPVAVTPCGAGYLYDFGADSAGCCTLRLCGEAGQSVYLSYVECCRDGKPDRRNLTFPDYPSPYINRVQECRYICRGGGEETFTPYFSYYGFRYVYVEGVTAAQATENLLTALFMSGDFAERGTFACSDETANRLQEMTMRSVRSNFLWFPTDCPHREKNGWTGDAVFSAEYMLLHLSVEASLREWFYNVLKAQAQDGGLPGIVPTGGWGFGTGPVWDQILVELPYCLWRLRGDLETARLAAPAIWRYLFRLAGKRNARGLIDEGLGDWCEAGKSGGGQRAPVEVTNTAVCVQMLEKAAALFRALGREAERRYAEQLRQELRGAFRRFLIDFGTMTVEGDCQTSQAVALAYGLLEEGERTAAFSQLLRIIREDGEHIAAGALGLRVLFRVLAAHGEAALAYRMITRRDYPSYGNWIERGGTALWEDFLPPEVEGHSQNHHFFGDISGWFIQSLAGIVPNPALEGTDTADVAPYFIEALRWAEGSYETPQGAVRVRWEREGEAVRLHVAADERLRGRIRLEPGWRFADGLSCRKLAGGTYLCRKAAEG